MVLPPKVYHPMRYVKSYRCAGHLYILSPAPVSVDRAYHKVWAWVKGIAPTALSLRNARDNLRRLSITKSVSGSLRLDLGARADEDGLEESVVHPSNVLKADRLHELCDLSHGDREI
jgi:hypothetical protein